MASRKPASDRAGTKVGPVTPDGRSISSALEAISELAARPHSLNDVLEAALDQVSKATRAGLVQLLLVDEGSGGLRVVAQRGTMEAVDPQDEVALGVALAAGVVDAGQIVLLDDLSRHPFPAGMTVGKPSAQAYLGLPLQAAGETVGAINLFIPGDLRFEAADAAALSATGRLVAMAVQNRKKDTQPKCLAM